MGSSVIAAEKTSHTDGRTDGQTDGQGKNIYASSPLGGGIIKTIIPDFEYPELYLVE